MPLGATGMPGIFIMADMARIWPIVCQFGVGGLLGLVGIWAGYTSGYLDLNLRAHRKLLGILVGGYVALLLFSCAFTFWLPFAGAEARP